MGTFSVEIGIGSHNGDAWVTLDALVDTGAFVTSAPATLLRGLGVEPMRKQEFTFADGSTREMDIGQARVRVGDREVTTLVMFNDEGSTPLLGTLALAGVFMEVDPLAEKLVPVSGLMGATRTKVPMSGHDTSSLRTFESALEWPVDEIPPTPLRVGLAMVRMASRELLFRFGMIDEALERQHRLAVQEADNKWQALQSRLKTEAAERFWIWAKGGAALLAAAGGGSVVTLIIQRLFPA